MVEQKKIVFIISKLNLGGAQSIVCDSVKYFCKKNDVFVVYFEGGAFEERLKALDCKLITIPSLRGKNPFGMIELIRILKKNSPDIVHSHLVKANFWGTLGAFFVNVPKRIISIHCVESSLQYVFFRFITRLSSRFASKVVAVSSEVKDFILEYNLSTEDKLVVVDNGIDVERFNPQFIDKRAVRKKLMISQKDVVVGTIGRLAKQKGQIYLIEAFAELTKSFHFLKLIIVGAGSREKFLKRKVAQAEIEDRVLFIKESLSPEELLAAMDIFVLPSLWEGLPLVILEAMAMGIPVVTTKVDGICSVVQNNCNALIINKKSSEDIVAKVQALLVNADLKRRLANNAQKTVVSRFCSNEMFRKLSRVYFN